MERSFYEKLVAEAIKDGIDRHVVAAIITKDFTVLLLKRPKNDFMGGIFELPSGKVEDGETLDAALFREVEEETGLKVRQVKKYLGYFDYNSKNGEKTRQFNFVVEVKDSEKIVLKEHDNFAWVSKERLNHYSITENVKSILDLFWRKYS